MGVMCSIFGVAGYYFGINDLYCCFVEWFCLYLPHVLWSSGIAANSFGPQQMYYRVPRFRLT